MAEVVGALTGAEVGEAGVASTIGVEAGVASSAPLEVVTAETWVTGVPVAGADTAGSRGVGQQAGRGVGMRAGVVGGAGDRVPWAVCLGEEACRKATRT